MLKENDKGAERSFAGSDFDGAVMPLYNCISEGDSSSGEENPGRSPFDDDINFLRG